MSAAAGAAPATGTTLREVAQRWWTDVKSGELGSLPIIFGLIIIAVVFQTQNDRFLTASNFVNLIVQSAAYTTIAMGIVFVLLLGEIDLSVGYVSGVAGVIATILLIPDGNEVPTVVAIVAALAAGAAIGTWHGILFAKVGIPSFVVTLAGLIAWNGVVLLLIGSRGTVILQDDFIINLANDFLSEGTAWMLMLVCVALYAATQLNEIRVRRKAGLEQEPYLLPALRVAGLAIALGVVVYVANQDRGIPYVGVLVAVLLLFWSFVLGPDALRALRVRRGRQRRGGAPGRHQRRPHPHLRLRDLLADGGGGRDHPRVAPALRGHERRRRVRSSSTRSPPR